MYDQLESEFLKYFRRDPQFKRWFTDTFLIVNTGEISGYLSKISGIPEPEVAYKTFVAQRDRKIKKDAMLALGAKMVIEANRPENIPDNLREYALKLKNVCNENENELGSDSGASDDRS